MIPSAIIFDLGGVLVRSVFKSKLALELQNKWGVTHEQWVAARKRYWYEFARGEITEKEFWKGFLQALGVKEDQKMLSKRVYGSFELMTDTIKLVKELKGNYRLAIISNNSHEWAGYLIKKYELNPLFDQIVLSCDEGVTKPSPEIFKKAAKRLDVSCGRCVFIDDKQHNVDAAKSVGMKGIKFEDVKRLRKELKRCGVKI